MQHRTLGRSDLRVPVVCFGAWAIGGTSFGATDDDEAVRAIQAAIDLGMNAIDTAPLYGFGHSERVVGRALADRRERAIVMTKVGGRWDDERGVFRFEDVDASGRRLRVHSNSRPDSVRCEVEQSLARLGVETIDLVQVHWRDPSTPIADTMGALADLRREGKLRAIGVSNYSRAEIEEAQHALGDVPLASDQPKYNLLAREIEKDILPFARAKEIGVLVYSPLEKGLLTGKVSASRMLAEKDLRQRRLSFTQKNRERVNALLHSIVQPIADAHGATIGQVVIAWTVAQPGVTSALVGARTVEQVRENAAAGELVLSNEDLATIRRAFEGLKLAVPFETRIKSKLKRLVKRVIGRG